MTEPANWRASESLNDYLIAHNLVAMTGVDTRQLTQYIRDRGAPNGALIHDPEQNIDPAALKVMAASWPGLKGMDLAKEVTCTSPYDWEQSGWSLGQGFTAPPTAVFHVVAVDFGAKHNILRCLVEAGCRVTVMPATATAEQILALKPDGVFLSNGPGDPAATGAYAVPMIKGVLKAGTPIFGICLGHQMLCLALGAETKKMHMGHRGANQPVKDLTTERVEITSQNHGFMVDKDSLPATVKPTHLSLFDDTLEGISLEGRPVFSVQHHPEASAGPHDSHYLFRRFTEMMAVRK